MKIQKGITQQTKFTITPNGDCTLKIATDDLRHEGDITKFANRLFEVLDPVQQTMRLTIDDDPPGVRHFSVAGHQDDKKKLSDNSMYSPNPNKKKMAAKSVKKAPEKPVAKPGEPEWIHFIRNGLVACGAFGVALEIAGWIFDRDKNGDLPIFASMLGLAAAVAAIRFLATRHKK